MIGADAIANTGQTETNKILNQLVPSFNFPQPSIADGTDALRPATLRGLSPDQTLVLVNGKRRHVSALLNINGTVGRGSAAVDLNLIPGLAISRVEVLRDGAAAQYGSDAIAGVINIQLKNSNHGGSASVTWGEYLTTVNDVAQRHRAADQRFRPADPQSGGQPLFPRQHRRRPQGAGRRADDCGRKHRRAARCPWLRQRHRRISFRGGRNRAGYDLRPNYIRPTSTTFRPARGRASTGSSSVSGIPGRTITT